MKTLRQSVADPMVYEVALRTAFLIYYYSISKRKYFDRFLYKAGAKFSFRTFEALVSETYLKKQFPTRGKHKGRSGKVLTIPFDLYLSMVEAVGPAKDILSEEFHQNRKQISAENQTKQQQQH